MTLGKPQVTYLDDTYRFEWSDLGISAIAERFHEDKDDVRCELTITSADPVKGGRYYRGRLLLIGPNSLRDVANQCAEADPELNWRGMISQIRDLSLDHYRSGEPLVDLREVVPGDAPQFLVYPFMLDRVISMVYGDGDAAKSVLALTLATVIASGQEIAGLSATRNGPVVYFDWEDDDIEHARRLRALCDAHGIDIADVPIYYQRMSGSLAETGREMRRKVAEKGAIAGFVDSAGMASAGDPNDAGAMIRVLVAARGLGVPVFVIHHLKKDATAQEKKSPYGSVYARNEVRLSWLVESVQAEGDGEIRSVYSCTKGNHTGTLESTRLAFTFTNEGGFSNRKLVSLEVRRLDWLETTDIQAPSQKWQIINLLLSGPRTTAQISTEIGIKANRVRTVISNNKEMFVNVGTDHEPLWGISDENHSSAPGAHPPMHHGAQRTAPPGPPKGAVVRAENEEETEEEEPPW